MLPAMKVNENYKIITLLRQRYSCCCKIYWSFGKKIRRIGIGRPSTYAPTFYHYQQKLCWERKFRWTRAQLHTIDFAIRKSREKLLKENTGSDKEISSYRYWNDCYGFLGKEFRKYFDYNFTAKSRTGFWWNCRGNLSLVKKWCRNSTINFTQM
jgi:hypothetical protein